MAGPFHRLRSRPRLASAMLLGIGVAFVLPESLHWVTRCLLGWNVAVWLYLLLMALMMLRADHERLRRVALAHAEGAALVLAVVITAAVASVIGVIVELTSAKVPGAPHAVPHVLFALATVVGSWMLLPTLFTLTYASAYYGTAHGAGLKFPESGNDFRPGYSDFLYFAFTIAVASQTADVSVSSGAMRRLVLLQSILSFAFNTAILALTINIAASMF